MPYYPLFYKYDIPDDTGDIVAIAEYLGVSIGLQDVWSSARQYAEPPHLGNVYLKLLFTRLANKINTIYPELAIDYEVNALASYFNVNGERLCSVNQLITLLEDN